MRGKISNLLFMFMCLIFMGLLFSVSAMAKGSTMDVMNKSGPPGIDTEFIYIAMQKDADLYSMGHMLEFHFTDNANNSNEDLVACEQEKSHRHGVGVIFAMLE